MKKKLFFVFKILFLTVFVITLVGGIYFFVVASGATLDVAKVKTPVATLKIYDKYGDEMRLSGYRKGVQYDNIPQDLIDAFVCIEDKNFFSHNGVDTLRILKAFVKNVINLNFTGEGASTITQQLIKNTHLNTDKTIDRKIREIKLAIDLEKVCTKEEILESYLDVIYFGNSIYGLNEASYRFFGKDYCDLSLSECAVMVAVIKSPGNYSPLRNYEKCLSRRNLVLKEMYDDGYISESEYKSAVSEALKTVNGGDIGAKYVSAVIDEACSRLGVSEKELAYGGYKIYTSYDPITQENIENIAKDTDYIPLNKSGEKADSCIVVCDNATGLVSAYYNSYSNTTELRRQPGSTIKPFVSYLPALVDGKIYPASPVLDEARVYGDYAPKNYGGKYIGWTNVRTALAKSLNSVAVSLMNDNGVINSIQYASKYGIEFDEKDYTLATALGGMTKGVTPIELSSAYMTLANGGYYKNIGFIKYITDKNGENIANFAQNGYKVESDGVSYLMTDMLYGVVNYGTAGLLKSNYKIASKTGTVQNADNSQYNNDLWNLSYTSENTVCVWIGNVSNSIDSAIENGFTAGVYPTRIAKKIYDGLYQNHTPEDIPKPNGIVSLPYSKNEYKNDNVLLLANQFYTKDEVKYDIFDSSILPEESGKRCDIVVNFDDVTVEIIKGTPNIRFKTQENLRYTIFRSSLLGDYEVVTNIDGDGNTFSYIDEDASAGGDYVYKIEACIINYAGEKTYLETSKEHYVSLPYNLWV